MADGGVVIKFNGKEVERCYAVAFDYDEWKYTVNDTDTKELPMNVKTVTIEIEQE